MANYRNVAIRTWVLLIMIWIFPFACMYAGGTIQWQNTIGGRNMETLKTIQQTFDGGYIIGSSSKSDSFLCDKTEANRGDWDYWIVKLDSIGNVEWQNTIGGNGEDLLEDLQQTADSGYIVGGSSRSNMLTDKAENSQGALDYWVLKLDVRGNIVWQNTIGGDMEDELCSVQQTFDGGYIIGGSSRSTISGDKTEARQGTFTQFDYWVVKLDASGNVEWQNTIGGNDYDYLSSLQQTKDSGYIIAGSSGSFLSGDKTEDKIGSLDGWILKLDKTGNIQWQNTIGTQNVDVLSAVSQTHDNGYIVGITTNADISGDKTGDCKDFFGSCFKDYWILKLYANGNIQWQNTIGGAFDDNLSAVFQTSDNGYILGGTSQSDSAHDHAENNQGTYDLWVVKTDALGNIQWEDNLGGNVGDYFGDIRETKDKGYIIGSYSHSSISGDKTEGQCSEEDLWIIKLTGEGIPTSRPGEQQLAEKISVYPNPFSQAVTFEFKDVSKAARLTIYDMGGQAVYAADIRLKDAFVLQRGALPSGLYMYSVHDKNEAVLGRGKLIVH